MTDKPRKTLEQMRQEALSGEGKDAWSCPACGCNDFRVTNTWQGSGGNRKRLRKCRKCNEPMATCEMPVPDGSMLIVMPINNDQRKKLESSFFFDRFFPSQFPADNGE